MRVCDLRYSGIPAWPPAWTSSLPARIFQDGRVDAVLRRVCLQSGGLEIEVEAAGELLRGLLFWDGPPRAATLKQLLEHYIGCSLSEAGDAAVRRQAA